MDKIESVISYIYKKYPFKEELSKSRLAKIIYLADWKSCLEKDSQITDIKWFYNHYGPYVDDILDKAKSSERLEVVREKNMHGQVKERIELSEEASQSEFDLSDDEKDILDLVINKTADMYWDDFMNFIYSTFPITHKSKGSILNLVELSEKYRRQEPAEQKIS